MSTRAMGQRYSSRGGRSFPDLDLFGIGKRRRLSEAQAMSDIDVGAEKEIQNLRQAHEKELIELKTKFAESLSNNDALRKRAEADGIVVKDADGNVTPSFTQYINEVMPIRGQNLKTGAEMEGSKLRTGQEFFNSEQGKADLTTGLRGSTLKPAFETARIGERMLAPGATGQFYDPLSLSTKPTTGMGAMQNITEFKNLLNPQTMQYQSVPTRQSGMTPGRFMQPLDPRIKAQVEEEEMLMPYNTSGSRTSVQTQSDASLRTMPEPSQQWRNTENTERPALERLKLLMQMFGNR